MNGSFRECGEAALFKADRRQRAEHVDRNRIAAQGGFLKSTCGSLHAVRSRAMRHVNWTSQPRPCFLTRLRQASPDNAPGGPWSQGPGPSRRSGSGRRSPARARSTPGPASPAETVVPEFRMPPDRAIHPPRPSGRDGRREKLPVISAPSPQGACGRCAPRNAAARSRPLW